MCAGCAISAEATLGPREERYQAEVPWLTVPSAQLDAQTVARPWKQVQLEAWKSRPRPSGSGELFLRLLSLQGSNFT